MLGKTNRRCNMTYTKEQAVKVRDAIQKMLDDGVGFSVGSVHFLKTKGGYMAYDTRGDDDYSTPDVVITGEIFRVTADAQWTFGDVEDFYVQIQFRNSGWIQVRSGSVAPLRRFGVFE